MIILYGYLALGVLVLIIIFSLRGDVQNQGSESLVKLLEEVRLEHSTLSDEILNKLVAPVFGIILIVCCWPLAIYMKIKTVSSDKNTPAIEDEPEFFVTRRDLKDQLLRQEIEAREVVYDPLGAAPNSPFGHLNAAWSNFINDCSDRDELWSFVAQSKTSWGQKETRTGYVIVQMGITGKYFLTTHQLVEDDV